MTYRTVAIYLLLGLIAVGATLYTIHPEWYSIVVRRMSNFASEPAAATMLAQNQARFVNLDGKVEIKKANSIVWGNADYHTTLDKGDLVRTGPDGAARITFVDGTTYTVKNDSFVTVEENSIDRDRATSVAVHISTGAVDLATGTWESPNSKAEVSFANARASLQENSRAAVRSDSNGGQNQITVSVRCREHAGGRRTHGNRQMGTRDLCFRWTRDQDQRACPARSHCAGEPAAADFGRTRNTRRCISRGRRYRKR